MCCLLVHSHCTLSPFIILKTSSVVSVGGLHLTGTYLLQCASFRALIYIAAQFRGLFTEERYARRAFLHIQYSYLEPFVMVRYNRAAVIPFRIMR
jgi:hypothetical protein